MGQLYVGSWAPFTPLTTPVCGISSDGTDCGVVVNLNPLKYCFHGQHSRPRATFRTLPGVKNKREVCAECFEKIMADRKAKKKLQQPR